MKRYTTTIDEFVDKMTKEELYDEYWATYQELAQCLEQIEELEYYFEDLDETKTEYSIQTRCFLIKTKSMLEKFKNDRSKLFNEYFRLKENK